MSSTSFSANVPYRRKGLESTVWIIPSSYALCAIAAGLTLPRIESRLWPHLVSAISVPAAMAIYSAIASGMISLTGIVFSLTFVMVQFSATAYSPRLVLWIARDPVMSHALGIFTATFLYSVAALTGVDRGGSVKVPFISAWIVVALLLTSVTMFISLVHRIGVLQVSRMLIFTGDQGRRVIEIMYQSSQPAASSRAYDFRRSSSTQTLVHHGKPRSIQAIDVAHLVAVAKGADAVIEVVVAVGDTVVESRPLFHVFGGRRVVNERELRRGIEVGGERRFDQDPKYAIRLLVDIAIKALSPAINDPTTAVQALDQIEDLLLCLGRSRLDVGEFHDGEGKLRLVVPFPAWEDFLRLAFDEIRSYGASSVQVMRRMNALVSDLIAVVLEERRASLRYWEKRLQATVRRSFQDSEDKTEALVEDRQGLGIPRRNPLAVAGHDPETPAEVA